MKFAPLLLAFCLVACASGEVRNPEVNYPLTDIQGAVDASLPLGRRTISANAREFESNYFILQGKKLRRATNAKTRLYAKVWVLGDRRPYSVGVTVFKEQRSGVAGSSYSSVGTDERIARLLLKKIETEVKKRVGNRNVIDDFRVF